MTMKKNPNDEERQRPRNDLSGEAAGMVRWVSRTVGRGIVRAPIGRLPQAGRSLLRKRVPIRRVAKVTDRVSTGLDLWNTAAEVQEPSVWKKIRTFTVNLVKNTFLGMAVFESYGYLIGAMAPSNFDDNIVLDRRLIDDESEEVVVDEADEYARASLFAHLGAGAIAGSVHGLLSSAMETPTTKLVRYTVLNTLHHSVAHATLFTSYEFTKRIILSEIHQVDNQTTYFGGAYLATFGVAGGAAGQLQHISSHYTEHWFGLSGSVSLKLRRLRLIPAPSLLPILFAFPPSALGFVAFEYGKKFVT